MTKLKALIIDDEKLARDIIINYLGNNNEIEVVGECSNGFDGIKRIEAIQPDIVFLDIQMPKISGFEMLELLDVHPEIIFTTAFDSYALKAFEVNATDYLLKPFSIKRFNEALDKAVEKVKNKMGIKNGYTKLLSSVNENISYIDRIVVKTNQKITIIPIEKVKFIEAQDDYVMIHSELGKFLKKQTMKYYEEHMDEKTFIRIHRSFIVNINKVKQIDLLEKESYILLLNEGDKIPVSRSGYSKIKELL